MPARLGATARVSYAERGGSSAGHEKDDRGCCSQGSEFLLTEARSGGWGRKTEGNKKIGYIHPIDMWAPLVGATSVHSQRPRQHPERVWTRLDLDDTRSQVREPRNDILEVEGPR
jgi:hypothetical protein